MRAKFIGNRDVGTAINVIVITELTELTREDLPAVRELCEGAIAGLWSFPTDWLERQTFGDADFDPGLTFVARGGRDRDRDEDLVGRVVGFCAGVVRPRRTLAGRLRKTGYLKFLAVDPAFRNRGIGGTLLSALLRGLKARGCRRCSAFDSNPRYAWPGLDPRFTEAYFFLKKHGFKRKGERVNLHVALPVQVAPPTVSTEFRIRRAKPAEKDALAGFVRENFATSTWDDEAAIAFENDPPTAFVALEGDREGTGKIAGFAVHSAFFPGSFGPTGVRKDLRGRGLGTALVRACADDLAAAGFDVMEVMWVADPTIKFYSKAVGARVGRVYWRMVRRVGRP
ncbi:MAG: hypothetical protein Kow0069_27150 [Promethearchaeota archaeon]